MLQLVLIHTIHFYSVLTRHLLLNFNRLTPLWLKLELPSYLTIDWDTEAFEIVAKTAALLYT